MLSVFIFCLLTGLRAQVYKRKNAIREECIFSTKAHSLWAGRLNYSLLVFLYTENKFFFVFERERDESIVRARLRRSTGQ